MGLALGRAAEPRGGLGNGRCRVAKCPALFVKQSGSLEQGGLSSRFGHKHDQFVRVGERMLGGLVLAAEHLSLCFAER